MQSVKNKYDKGDGNMMNDSYISSYKLVERNRYNLSGIDSIIVRSERGDIIVGTTSGKYLEVGYYIKSDVHKIKYAYNCKEVKGKLSIELKSKIPFLSFDFYTGIVLEMKIPESYISKLKIRSSTASVIVKECNMDKLSIVTGTGSIKMNDISVSKLHVKSTSGDIKIRNISERGTLLNERSSITTATGSIETYFNCLYAKNTLSTTAGNISLGISRKLERYDVIKSSAINPNSLFKKVKCDFNFNVKTATGKIKVFKF